MLLWDSLWEYLIRLQLYKPDFYSAPTYLILFILYFVCGGSLLWRLIKTIPRL